MVMKVFFKHFVRSDDARRSRHILNGVTDITDNKGDIIVWLMLGINLLCFVIVTISYALMNIKIKRSSKKSGSNQNPGIRRENREIQNKITVIIATDFLCWVPFIIISALHNVKVINATYWYVTFAMTMLPFNSVVNPLIYDNKLRNLIWEKIQLVFNLISNSRVVSSIRQRWLAREEDIANAEIEMEPPQNEPAEEDIANVEIEMEPRLQNEPAELQDVTEPVVRQIIVQETDQGDLEDNDHD